MDYLVQHKDKLHPELLQRWGKSGFGRQGSWGELFGGGPEAEEVFSAWHYARYIDQVAAAGQAEYALPMYVNAWLAAKLGTYPTGGPVAHMHDVWRAAAPHIALLAPDIYVGEFKEVCAAYARAGNPLWVPEASRDDEAAARAYWVDCPTPRTGLCTRSASRDVRDDHPLVGTYRILRQLLPLVTEAQGHRADDRHLPPGPRGKPRADPAGRLPAPHRV